MKTFQTTTNIAPIISVGTYWGHFDEARRCPIVPAPQVPYVDFPIPRSYDIGAFVAELEKRLEYNPKLTVSLHKLRARYRIRVEETS